MFSISVLISFSVALASFLLATAIYNIRKLVPKDERQYMDPLPLLMKLFWPLIKFLAFYLGERLSVEYIEKSKIKLQRSGLGYLLTPQEFFAIQVVSALIFFLISLWMMVLLEKPIGIAPFLIGIFGFFFPILNLTDRRKKREQQIIRMLPDYLDFMTMAVEAGLSLNGALLQAVEHAPAGPLNVEFQKVISDIKAGVGKVDALKNMAERLDIKDISNVVAALAQAEKLGASMGTTLRIQADQKRVERFQRAEKLAMQAPVKLVGPLVLFIFPTTFIILFFPIATQLVAVFSN